VLSGAQVLEDSIDATWVNREGTSIDYSSIDLEVAFWDPEGKELFGADDDPDDDEESYTGNEGGESGTLFWDIMLPAQVNQIVSDTGTTLA
jgi:hypothetical protein